MHITFHGAAREVTGSCHLIDTDHSRLLIDCGMFQGRKFAEEENADDFPFDPKSIDAVVLTHAHMDHCGRLPKLVKDGFRGSIFCTAATRDFAAVMLRDSAKVIWWEAKKDQRPPVYENKHVTQAVRQMVAVPYHQTKRVTDDVTVELFDAGHILGSAFARLTVGRGSDRKTVLFSGDLGNPPAPIVRDTEPAVGADYVVVESTYGNRVHEPASQRLQLLQQAVEQSVKRGGTLMIPAFALERTQEVLYELNHLVENDIVPDVPIYVDSPLAIAATAVYKKYTKYYDKESKALIQAGDDLFNFPGLQYTKTVQQSKKINSTNPPKVILAGSGMLVGGRMMHHLKRYLPDPNSHLLIISYQPKGGLGRKLLDGARFVMVDDDRIPVRCHISAIGGYSSHADQPKLLRWLEAVKQPQPQKVFIVHGEPPAAQALAQKLQSRGVTAVVPAKDQRHSL